MASCYLPRPSTQPSFNRFSLRESASVAPKYTPGPVGYDFGSCSDDYLLLTEAPIRTQKNKPVESPKWPASGELPFSVRELLDCEDHFFDTSGYSVASGHQFLALNSLGKSWLSPASVAELVMHNLGKVFPGGAEGILGNQVFVGNIFKLQTYPTFVRFGFIPRTRFEVECVNVDKWSFTLKAMDWHLLRGTARHGIVKDKTGELWMLQEGRGEPGKEKQAQMFFNYFFGRGMWRKMANNVKSEYLTDT